MNVISVSLPSLNRLGLKYLLVSLLQHDNDDDDDLEDIPTEDLPIGKSSVGIPGVCQYVDDYDDNEYGDKDEGVCW